MATDRQTGGQDGGTYGSAAAAEAWRRGAAARAHAMGPVTEMMLDLAGVGPGRRVLDVAAGSGEQTLMAARRVGPTGSVLATDVAARMLAVAAEAAREAGLANVETRVMDARDIGVEPESFDAAVSRLALMLIPQRDKALAGIRRALRPGGKLAAIVLSTAEQNPYTALPLAIARRHAGLPPLSVEDPGMFALGDSATLGRAYEQAGFREVSVHAVSGARRFASAPEAVQARRDSGPEASELMAELSDAEREAAWAEVEAVFRRFEGDDGIVLPIEWLIGVGTK
jgi:ubiquinone/menaquinone biosynthesis C-methylase UbiE